MLAPVEIVPLALVLEDLGIAPETLRPVTEPVSGPEPRGTVAAESLHAIAGVRPGPAVPEETARRVAALARERTTADGMLLVMLQGERPDAELAAWRDALWPEYHVGRAYRLSQAGIRREAFDGTTTLRGATGARGVLLVARRREVVLSPTATVAKFDRNAPGWAGDPASPGYAHHRWMRRFVATFVPDERLASVRRILDFGCGAGWVGIEAALAAPGASLAAFDPSPEMVRLARENARACGVERFEARTGFGEAPPFPAEGEEPFDLVISSGVLSFSPEPERWIDGLAGTVAPGGTVVLGDVHRDARGMRRRRRSKPLLPAREMNASTRGFARAELEARGFAFEAWCGYQLTWPVPELMHLSERLLGGVLHGPLLAWNRWSAARDARRGSPDPDRYDSWVLRMRRV